MHNNRKRMGTGLAAAVAVAVGFLAVPPVLAATTNVAANDNRTFSPQTVNSAVGGSVHWTASGVDDHANVCGQGLRCRWQRSPGSCPMGFVLQDRDH